MSCEQIFSICESTIPTNYKTDFWSSLAQVNKYFHEKSVEFTNEVLDYLAEQPTVTKICKVSDTKAIMHRKMSTDPSGNVIGLYEVDLLHGIVKFVDARPRFGFLPVYIQNSDFWKRLNFIFNQ